MKYIIAWRSWTGLVGRGTAKYSAEAADQIVGHANEEFPDIPHWKEEVDD